MAAVPPVSTERLVSSGRFPERLVVVVAVVLGILIVKPWNAPPPAASPASLPARHETDLDEGATPSSIGPAVSPGPNDIACQGGWRLVSITHQATWMIKDWTPVHPSPGPGPVGGDIPFIALTGVVRAIGVCGEGQDLGSADRNVAIGGMWRVTDADGRVTASSVPLDPTGDAAQPPAFARLYRPVGADAGKAWSPGRYVLELDVAGAISWLGIVVSGQTGAS